MEPEELSRLQRECTEVRLAVLREIEVAGSGHYGSSYSAVEILVALYYRLLDVRSDDPEWPVRDRFVLSKGHACSALYPILTDLGFFDPAHLGTFTRLGSILGDHPDRKKIPGVDFSAGSLGHGLSVAVGMALAARQQGYRNRVVALIGDGEQNEGQIWEAAAFASARRLGDILAVVDRNGVQVDGTTEETLDMEPMADKWRAFGWRVEEVDGHDLEALAAAFDRYDKRRPDGQPSLVIAHTVAGKGIGFIENQAAWHVGYLHGPDAEEAERLVRAMYPVGGRIS
jgi:transketolase